MFLTLPISVHAGVRAASGGVLSEDCNGAPLEGIKLAGTARKTLLKKQTCAN